MAGSAPEITMNQVQKHTAVHTRFACNMIALVDGLPRTLNLKEFLSTFLDFRCSVVKRRAEHEHNKASKRLHLVEGFLIAMTNMDNVVSVIRQAVDGDMALRQLQSKYLLTREQAEGVLGLTLRRLTSLEAQKLKDEQATLKVRIDDINDLLVRKQRILEVVLKEAEEIAERYGTDRRTNIIDEAEQDLAVVDLIPNSPGIIVFSRKGYIKRMKLDTFAVQGIRGIGK
jgi:DNA gyrase subunit A